MFQFEIDEADSIPAQERSTPTTSFKIGDRVRVENDKGVVKYIGIVGNHAGEWIGIEWDDPARGKHNGTVEGVEYFKCSQPGGNGGSLVRPQKVNLIRDLMNALHEKYTFDKKIFDEIKQIEDRLERILPSYKDLTVLDLSGSDINEIGDAGEFIEACPNTKSLFLAKNHLTSLRKIYELCSRLKHLNRIDISENPLDPPDLVDYSIPITSVDHLIAGKINYDWQDVLKTTHPLTSLTILQIHFNRITAITCLNRSLINLRRLDLEGNHIARWSDIMKLGSIILLEYLNLAGNKIPQISFPKNKDPTNEDSITDAFSNLVYLNISENCIQDWSSINELNKLRILRELRIDTNPFLDSDTRQNNRQYIIARIERLEKLEGVEIGRKERRDAELDYVKRLQTGEVTRLSPEFNAENPRYLSLVKKFGLAENDDDTIVKKPKILSLKKNMINVKITSNDPSSTTTCKDLLETMPINKLKKLIKSLFKKRTLPMLKVISSRNPSVTFELENDFYTLSKYSIEHGDIIMAFWD